MSVRQCARAFCKVERDSYYQRQCATIRRDGRQNLERRPNLRQRPRDWQGETAAAQLDARPQVSTTCISFIVCSADGIRNRLSDPKQAYYAQEAREFLRKRLIGKHVKVHVDFVRPREGEYEERECATVRYGNQNVLVRRADKQCSN